MEIETLRHSCSHIMADAVKRLYPQAKLGIGPAIDNGFYYDFEIPGGVKEEDLPAIEAEMKKIVNSNAPFIKEEWSQEKALEYFSQKGETYKVELIKDLAGQQITVYKHGEFLDLCRGPHIKYTSGAKHFKLLSLAGAYWRGNEKNAMLVRVYGTCFPTKDELEKHLKNLEEAKLRDHRVLGPQLGLVDIYQDQAGAGLVFYLPHGALLRRTIEDWEIKEHFKRGYQMVTTPHIMDKKLWQQSGHWDYYQENMYTISRDNQEFVLKPMNCPGHILIYKSQMRSYRDLPLRMFELGTVYRYEKSGVLHGLLRVRGFTQDDAHIFCKKEDQNSEIEGVLDFVQYTMDKFGFKEYSAELSTRPEKFIGDKADWDLAEKILEEILKKKNINYQINAGDGAFYGPKIDIKLKDALGRSWQCATVQLDYALPKRFNITYRAASGEDVQPVMIHRVLFGSLERFIATLIEHYAGRFPVWLAPLQAVVLNVTSASADYALAVKGELLSQGWRVEADTREETLQRKIRDHELKKVPYILVVGDREKEQANVSVRKSGKENLGVMKTQDFIDLLKKEV